MNAYAISAIYRFELARWFRTLVQSLLSPVISTSLYFVVFGAAIGSRMGDVDGVGYGDNAKAALITRGLAEITRFAVAKGAHPMTLAGLAGVGAERDAVGTVRRSCMATAPLPSGSAESSSS